MMDWTDRHCRAFHRQLTRHALLYTEMVTAPAILHGDRQRLPSPALYAAFASRGIGLEVMDNRAACRTYNLLLGEFREVAIALMF